MTFQDDAQHVAPPAKPDLARLRPVSVGVWLDDRLNRLGVRGAFARDSLLAVLCVLVSSVLFWSLVGYLTQVNGVELSRTTVVFLVVLMIAQSLSLCFRRVNLLVCVFATAITQCVIASLVPPDISMLMPAVVVAAYTCGVLLRPRRIVWLVSAAVAIQCLGIILAVSQAAPSAPSWTVLGTVSVVLDAAMTTSGPLLSIITVNVGAALVGTYVTMRRRYIKLVRLRTEEDIRVQRERAENAVWAERSRMARELHDIAAHHLSGMVVQAAAVDQLIGRDDEAAKQANRWVRSQGKETLEGLRMVVGALREPGESDATGASLHHQGEPGADGAPVPGLGTIDRLVRGEREMGTALDFERVGQAYDLPPVADVTFYRVAQEALSNAREHAAGAEVRMALRYTPSEMILDVENRPGRDLAPEDSDAPRGLGLLGMRERAQLIGAVLDVGPTSAGGWSVSLALPITRDVSMNGSITPWENLAQ